jgi:anti-anti-sigma factor
VAPTGTAPAGSPGSFTVVAGEGGTTVRLEGELDLSWSRELESALRDAQGTAGTEGVVIDLAGLTFVDSSGLLVLLTAHRRAQPAVPLRLRGARGQVKRVFELTGLSEALV